MEWYDYTGYFFLNQKDQKNSLKISGSLDWKTIKAAKYFDLVE